MNKTNYKVEIKLEEIAYEDFLLNIIKRRYAHLVELSAIRSDGTMLHALIKERKLLMEKVVSESFTEDLKIFLEQRKDDLLNRIRQLDDSLNVSFQA